MKLLRHEVITGTIECVTGLRIGGNTDSIQIGGMDNPIIRHPLTREPFIPGSSLKGKLRSLLESNEGLIPESGRPHGCKNVGCRVCRTFGPHFVPDHGHGPTRLIVRDAPLTEASRNQLMRLLEDGLTYAEVKSENWIDRRTGIAGRGGLRSQERVPAGAVFGLEFSIRVFEDDDEDDLRGFLFTGLRLLENDTLGSSGTRGYGKVKIMLDGHDLNT
ncbi:type III-A CRISPR-associated RAMP protein Csm3 [Candidatus Poribacteria bacterium]|nr:type III-A CRISPR-associated RAMP protein Csm3 [Candidatus Poribacteria bacterium]